MELTEDMLRRIATNIAELRLRLSLLGQITAQERPISEEFEKLVQQTVKTPEFQNLREQIFEQLKGGH